MKHVAVITGAAQNIGKGIARSLLEQGFSCVLLDNNEVALHATATELQKLGDCREYVADVANLPALRSFLEWLDEQSLTIEVLVNNVGFNSHEDFLHLSEVQLRQSNQTNLEGPFILASWTAQRMIDNKTPGNIVFISSVHSTVVRTHPLYSVAKAGIEMFVKEAALEVAPHGIRVNAVAPGPVKDTADLTTSEYVPLGYAQQPQDIGEAVAFLVSEKARFITGQSLVVDGGFSLAHTHHWLKRKKL